MPKLRVVPAFVKKQAVVVVSFAYTADTDMVAHLVNGCAVDGASVSHAHASIVLFSMYRALDAKMCAALDASRVKFTTLRVDAQPGHGILTFYTEPTFSAVRRVLATFARLAQPARLEPLYRKYAAVAGVKPDHAVFAHCANELANALATKCDVFVTGTVRVPEGSKALDEIVDRIKPDKVAGKTQREPAPEKRAETESESKMHAGEIKTPTRLESLLVQQILDTQNIASHVCYGNVYPVTGNSSWETLRKRFDEEKIKKFVDAKLVRLGDRLPDVMRYMAAATGYFTATELAKLPDKYNAAQLTSMIKKALS